MTVQFLPSKHFQVHQVILAVNSNILKYSGACDNSGYNGVSVETEQRGDSSGRHQVD